MPQILNVLERGKDFLILYVLQRGDSVQFCSLRQQSHKMQGGLLPPPHLQSLEAVVAGWQLIPKLDPEGSHFRD